MSPVTFVLYSQMIDHFNVKARGPTWVYPYQWPADHRASTVHYNYYFLSKNVRNENSVHLLTNLLTAVLMAFIITILGNKCRTYIIYMSSNYSRCPKP